MTMNNDPVRLLTEVEHRAIELKFYGYEYKDIGKMLNEEFPDTAPAWTTVRDWFAKAGKLHEAYKLFLKEQSDINVQEGRDMMKAYAKKAMQTVVMLMANAKNEGVKLEASKEVMGRIFGQIPKVVTQKNNSLVHDILKEAGLIDDEVKTNEELDTGKGTEIA